MTAIHHTPLSFGGPLTSAAMEAPLSQLDAAIATVIATGSGVSTTLTAQATAGTSGPFSVASTTGLLPGDAVWFGSSGGPSESRIINTVPSGTTFTTTANLTGTYAIGKPVSKSPVEIVDARATYTTLGGRIGAIESRVFDVKRYGAKGDGVTDDTAGIEAASLAAGVVKGTVFFPPGTYIVSWFLLGADWAGIAVRSGCALRGSGIGATTIKLANSQPEHNVGIIRNLTDEGGDEGITIADLTVDGNGANQTTLYQGVQILAARGVRHERVRVMNVRGTSGVPPGETFAMVCSTSTDISYIDCEVIRTAGSSGSGFSSNLCTNVIRVNCIARGMSFGHGFADWKSRGVLNVNCIGQQNAGDGFHVENSEDIVYASCRAGGRTADGPAIALALSAALDDIIDTTTAHGFVAGDKVAFTALTGGAGLTVGQVYYVIATNLAAQTFQVSLTSGGAAVNFTTDITAGSVRKEGASLGSAAYGILVFESVNVLIDGCLVSQNVAAGINITGTAIGSKCRVVGGDVSANTHGIQIDSISSVGSSIDSVGIHDNVTSAIRHNGVALNTSGVPSPAVPASTVALTNPYPFPCTVYVVAGTVTSIVIDSYAPTGATSGAVPLPAGGTITLTYSSPPTWSWWRR